ncbi:MAG: phenylacetate--CoA ligase family protein [Gemmatimonadales bacterium]|nr:phenylacetate--CoA ligase family protein [Gemmatimonadales bacterium]
MASPIIATAGLAAIGTLLRSSARLAREQWLSPEKLAARRRTRLRQMLARAAGTAYYEAAFRAAGLHDPGAIELHELERLPFLDRHTIAQHGLDAFLTAGRDGLVNVFTSGSTGMPGRFVRSRIEEADYSARWWRVYAAYGCSVRDAQINVATVGKPDRAGPISMLRKIGVLPRVERLASDAPLEQVLERVRELHPPILTGYAGAIEALADHVLATEARIQPPRAVFCTAMEVTDRCLELAEKAFQAPAVDVYVTNEFGVIAWSCPTRRELLHVNDDSFVVEVVGTDGRLVPPGTLGELVVTSLGLTSMPLIRYRMGDMAARVPERCECGRGLGLLTRVHGRTAHAIRRPSGALITTPVITSLIGRAQAYEWVYQFQVREEPGRRLRFLVDARRPPSELQRRELTRTIESALGQDFQIAVEIVAEIQAAPSGKLQFLVPLAG